MEEFTIKAISPVLRTGFQRWKLRFDLAVPLDMSGTFAKRGTFRNVVNLHKYLPDPRDLARIRAP